MRCFTAMRCFVACFLLLTVGLTSFAWSCGGYGDLNPTKIVAMKLATAEGEWAGKYADQLRAAGPEGLAAVLEVRDNVAAAVKAAEQPAPQPADPQQQAQPQQATPAAPAISPETVAKWKEQLERLDKAVDRVAGQRGASISRLFWYTDLEQATKAAKEAKKPILSLRMLGNLTEECSCANSRFFRTSLYSNAEVSKYLRENFVLHWKSVRPVPTVTIDFGDGRKLVRTVTGNSIHYLLDSDGRVVDALPGLYGPKSFQRWLTDTRSFAETLAGLSAKNQEVLLIDYHRNRARAVQNQWFADVVKVVPVLAVPSAEVESEKVRARPANTAQAEANTPTAAKAGERAFAKTVLEGPIVRQVVLSATQLEQASSDEIWKKIAALHAEDAKLDATSVEIIRRENPPTAAEAARLAVGKRRVEDPIVRMVRQFESSIALDAVRNEYLLHRQIHEWMAEGIERPEVEQLNERVYAQLFLTPSSDPWLGLAPADTYTALEKGGEVAEKR